MTPRDGLTSKEIEVATLVWQGLTNREIGRLTGTTEQVVKNHLRCAFDKLGVWSRLELAMYVASHGGKNWTDEPGAFPDTPSGRASGQESRTGTAGRMAPL
jgi:two-component system, NarL family, response regulator DevR